MVELGVGMLTALAGAYGGSLGAALLTAGLVVRLALLPLTLYLAERSRRHAEGLRALQPELTALRERHASDPQALLDAMSTLYRERGISPVDTRSLLGSLLQLPFLATAYNAVQRLASTGASFRWIADLSAPDLGVAALVAALTWASVALSTPDGQAGRIVPWIVAGVVFLVTSRLMAGLGLYMAASASVGLLQAALIRARQA
jgi:YidC/Oxa1 family membrane protein insertase